MAPLPKRRHSSRRQSKRARALSLQFASLVKCPQCGSLKVAHRVCEKCGYYAERQVLTIKAETKPKKE